MKRIPMTVNGALKLKEELYYLKNIRRNEIIKNISEARKYGDLKENSEYHAAKEQQGFCEGRIQDIETKLLNAQIIDITKISQSFYVIFGSTIHIKDIDTEKEYVYCIVGDDEADFKKNLISVYSPISRGLIGKHKNDIVMIKTPKGIIRYKITNVQYI